MVDKEKALIEYLLQYPPLQDNPLFFNFLDAKNDNKQFVTVANDRILDRSFVDGSVMKRYTFTLMDYRTVVYQAIVKQAGYPNENLEEFIDVQGIIDWIAEQEDNKNYPDFGETCIIEEIRTTTSQPNLNGVDTNVKPALAKYSVSIQIDYLDISKKIWN